ncbi:MAG TPA: hypothetical protein VFX45_00585 [Solirubrobacterales bacterium]|nr:hypothetical protein [Solirubrobacterales bacterium]
MSSPPQAKQRNAVASAVLAVVSVVAAVLGAGIVGPVIAVIGLVWLVTYTLRRVGANSPEPPRPRLSVEWLGEVFDYLGRLVAWAAPSVPFVAPALTFVLVTWLLAPESEGLLFQEQASQILLVLTIGYVIEAGALRWRRQPVDWLLSLVTVLILLVGETYCLVALATADPTHADVIAGALAAGVVAMITAAVQGSAARQDAAPGDGS